MVLAVYLALNDSSAKFLFPLCIAAFLSTWSTKVKKEPIVIRPSPDALSQQNVDTLTKAPEEAAAAEEVRDFYEKILRDIGRIPAILSQGGGVHQAAPNSNAPVPAVRSSAAIVTSKDSSSPLMVCATGHY